MYKGAFQTSRSTFESEIWVLKPAWWFKVWTYIIGSVNYKDSSTFKCGSRLFTYDQIFNECHLKNENIKKSAIKNCISYFKKAQMCTTDKTTRGFFINVINYKKYQNLDNYGTTVKTTKEPHRNHTIVEEGKKEKKRSSKVFSDDSIEMKLTNHMIKGIRHSVDSKFREPNKQNWCKEFDKLLRLDSRDKQEIAKILVCIHGNETYEADDFEMGNVLSPKKLRHRYSQLKNKFIK